MASVTERLQALALCLCAEIAKDKPTCFCGVLPGASVAHDYTSNCDDGPCGMAWVRLESAKPVTGIDLTDETLNNCGADLGFDVEVSIIRCAVVLEDAGPPSEAEQLEMATQQWKDMMTMRTAIACCEIGDVILRTYEPFGPTGGVFGGSWSVSMAQAG